MNWKEYSSQFSLAANLKGYPQTYTNVCLTYAKKLFDNNLPIIFEEIHLSKLIGIKFNYFQLFLKNPNKFYKNFSIKKANGNLRRISEPLPLLKFIQIWILRNILEKRKISRYAKAYIKNHSIVDSAKFHLNQKTVLRIDLIDFFGSITIDQIYNIFRRIGYSHTVSQLFSKICTLNNNLPQGAPTSPFLSNLVFLPFDLRLARYSNKNNIKYTRYADDLIFSGDLVPGQLIKFIESVLFETPFRINYKKLKVMPNYKSQTVNGIQVNNKLQKSRRYRLKVRQEVYYIKKFGLNDHLKKININKSNYLNHLIGKINFVLFLNPKDNDFQEYKSFLNSLL